MPIVPRLPDKLRTNCGRIRGEFGYIGITRQTVGQDAADERSHDGGAGNGVAATACRPGCGRLYPGLVAPPPRKMHPIKATVATWAYGRIGA